MSKFKKGDKVRRSQGLDSWTLSRDAVTVRCVDPETDLINIEEFDRQDERPGWHSEFFELVEPAPEAETQEELEPAEEPKPEPDKVLAALTFAVDSMLDSGTSKDEAYLALLDDLIKRFIPTEYRELLERLVR